MRRLAGVVVLAVVVLGAGCSKNEVRVGQAVIDIDKGSRVLIGERGQGLRPGQGRHTMHVGAQVKVLAGSASIALDDGARLDVRTGSEVDLGSPISLVADDLLVTAGNSPVKVAVAGSEVIVDGVARLRRDLAVSAATYRGTVTMRSAARSLTVPALRQADIASLGVLPAEPAPLAYDKADTWDRNFLGVAMDLADQLESRGKGFTSSLRPGEGHTAGFYRILLPDLEKEPAFDEKLIARIRDPGDTLIGATIAVSGKLGSFAERWAGAFTFKSQGATWGLVALDQQVNDTNALVHTIDVAIGAQSFAFAPPPRVTRAPAVAPATVVADVPAAPVSPRAPAPVPVAQPAPTTSTSGPPPLLTLPTLPPLLPAPNPDDSGILAPLLDVVTQTLDGLLSGK